MVTRSASESACILRITLPRWAFTVTSLMPRSQPPCLESAKNWGGAETPTSYSNHAMTGKQLSCLGIARDCSVAHVHHRVLDIGVPVGSKNSHPSFYQRLCPGIVCSSS